MSLGVKVPLLWNNFDRNFLPELAGLARNSDFGRKEL